MDREILFRGKRVDNSEWVYGSLISFAGGQKSILPSKSSAYFPVGSSMMSSNSCFDVNPCTVGQYTGLRDAENKRIFDGDILLYGNKHLVVWWNGEAFQWQAKEKQEVTYTFDGKKQAVVWDNMDLGWIAAEVPISGKMTTKVIGNIYDNPELLESK